MNISDDREYLLAKWNKINKMLIISRNKLTEHIVSKSDNRKLSGYYCRIAVKRSRNNRNTYLLGKIAKIQNDFIREPTPPVSKKMIMINFGSFYKNFNINVVSNSHPRQQEILEFLDQNSKQKYYNGKKKYLMNNKHTNGRNYTNNFYKNNNYVNFSNLYKIITRGYHRSY
jgi:hypothetical protein